MYKYPRFALVDNKRYPINTDFRVALECNRIAESDDISDEERSLAIIYLLFGEEGLDNPKHWNGLIEKALKYLKCGKEDIEDDDKEEVNMDFEQDWEYIRTSFFYDYKINLDENNKMHWWEFYNLLCGLSDRCIFNRVRFVRDFDINQIKDSKEREKWARQKQLVELKTKEKASEKTAEEERLDELFEKQLKGGE